MPRMPLHPFQMGLSVLCEQKLTSVLHNSAALEELIYPPSSFFLKFSSASSIASLAATSSPFWSDCPIHGGKRADWFSSCLGVTYTPAAALALSSPLFSRDPSVATTILSSGTM
ncbi:hypothetical protein D9758_013998 [Tetrapyrgos nigripes]|uniref:Uncharacterized protein n=1 Tax=Tetrapyrgos nigripes TaxID=182062 RepID=A0A8H5G7R0_9AGAR|nr:hypothetical protein D9758_013998 [Tetrapyrgos nigripes]